MFSACGQLNGCCIALSTFVRTFLWTDSHIGPRRLYILCWRELSRRRLLPAVSPAAGHLTTPTVAGLPGLCENFRPTTSKSSPVWRLLSSHWATSVVRRRVVGVCVWPVCVYSRFQWRQHVTDDAATYYAEQGLCDGRVSICLSRRSTAAASGFAAELPAGAAYQLWTIDICCRRLHSAGNVDSVMLRADGWGWTQTCCHWGHSL